MAGFSCPFCNQVMSIDRLTHATTAQSFDKIYYSSAIHEHTKCAVRLDFYKCPNCGEITITLDGVSTDISNLHLNVFPRSNAKIYPDYIPEAIRNDYEEACSIVDLSPKSAATLARRCLQGMIRDFWGINKDKLKDAIDLLQEKIPAAQWKAIDGLRRIGNIGAHMEKDVNLIIDIDRGETLRLLKLIELLLDKWYIARHDEEELCREITMIDDAMQAARHTP